MFVSPFTNACLIIKRLKYWVILDIVQTSTMILIASWKGMMTSLICRLAVESCFVSLRVTNAFDYLSVGSIVIVVTVSPLTVSSKCLKSLLLNIYGSKGLSATHVSSKTCDSFE